MHLPFTSLHLSMSPYVFQLLSFFLTNRWTFTMADIVFMSASNAEIVKSSIGN